MFLLQANNQLCLTDTHFYLEFYCITLYNFWVTLYNVLKYAWLVCLYLQLSKNVHFCLSESYSFQDTLILSKEEDRSWI